MKTCKPMNSTERETPGDRLIKKILRRIQFMQICVSVRISANPGEGYGDMNFNETLNMDHASFEIVASVFKQCHDLLATLKAQHGELKSKNEH